MGNASASIWENSTDPSLPPVTMDFKKWHSSECEVSIIMHCRGRPEVFRIALQSLLSTCSDYSAVEILVKLDTDDASAPEYLKVLQSFPFQHKLLIYDRLDAWWSVHVFETDLSRLANGNTMWLFNEDNAIVSGDWLSSFKQSRNIFPDNIYVCAVPGMMPKPTKTVAPAYSREWFDVLKIVSSHVFSDRFLVRVSGEVGRLLSTPLIKSIVFTHRSKEKVLRPPLNITKIQLTQFLDKEVKRCVPLVRSAIAASTGSNSTGAKKVYPPGTKVGPGYTN